MKKNRFTSALYIIIMLLIFTVAGYRLAVAPPAVKTDDFEKIKPETLVIGSGLPGDTYYLYAGSWASLSAEALEIPVTVNLTDGSHHNLILIQEGRIHLGMTTLGAAYEAWNGLENWTGGIEHKDIRSLFPMFNSYFHWIADTESGITCLRDMEGKNVGSGPTAGTMGVYGPRIFSLLGINARLTYGGAGELLEKQKKGDLAANGFASGIPVPAYREYEKSKGIKNVIFIGINSEERGRIIERWPYFSHTVIPAGTYGALAAELETVGIWSIAVAGKYLDDEVVYKIVKAVMENNKAMVSKGHMAAKETTAENLTQLDFIPLHPGAVRYFKEMGFKIPAPLIPPEYAE
ncbi:MAG: TAXI family TRAP transporter solute-binding subunit [Dethiobacter sp.]|jgi:TRAP transporter TAXI family solute receptor|nr:TAXI family TRAP transporter solute-binding subunit [Dethiobacter sp.]